MLIIWNAWVQEMGTSSILCKAIFKPIFLTLRRYTFSIHTVSIGGGYIFEKNGRGMNFSYGMVIQPIDRIGLAVKGSLPPACCVFCRPECIIADSA